MNRNIIIFSALGVEYKAVRSHLTDVQEIRYYRGQVCEQGKFSSNNQSLEVNIVEVGKGNINAAIETVLAIGHFNPNIVLFVGVAGGIKEDIHKGDVVVATEAIGYESGNAGKTFTSSPEVYRSDIRLIKIAIAEAKKRDWLNRLNLKSPENEPKVLIGPIAAGEKLITSRDNSLYNSIRNNYRAVMAVDMEGCGFLNAAYACQVPALIVRGISDLIDDKKGDECQEMASQHASAFAFEILAKLCPKLVVSFTIV
jgi:5'-methylthioadenosine/S-adenosylhomocysteine nucleosidase